MSSSVSSTSPGFAGRLAAAFTDSRLTPLAVVASLLLGIFAVVMLPREEEPQIKVPMVDVLVAMPGATAAEVENRVHHARHRGAGTRTYRNQQRIFPAAEFLSDQLRDVIERGLYLRLKLGRIARAIGIEISANLGGDGEAGRHRQAEPGHFRQARAFAAEQFAHIAATLSLAVTECVDPLRHYSIQFVTAGGYRHRPPNDIREN